MTSSADVAHQHAILLTDRPVRTGQGWRGVCPGHADTDPSLHITESHNHPGSVVVHCFAGCTFEHLAPILRARGFRFGGSNNPLHGDARAAALPIHHHRRRTPQREWAGPAHVPARIPDLTHPELGPCTDFYIYRTADALHHSYVAVYPDPDSKKNKTRRPWTWWRRPNLARPRCELGAPPKGQRILYACDHIAAITDAPIIIVEGEGTAETAQRLFPDCIASTWMMGSNASRYTDWTPTRGRIVILFPDNDAGAGLKACAAVVTHVSHAGGGCVWVSPRHSLAWAAHAGPVKDIEDAERRGLDLDSVNAWRRTLAPVHPLRLPP